MEGRTAAAAAFAAAELQGEPRASEYEASSHVCVYEALADRGVLSVLPTSTAARLAEVLVALIGTLPSSCLRFRLDEISRRSAPVQGRQDRPT
jgi:hypothetical protein|eukprot:3974394-Prymnesium_polylepis.1